MDPNPNEENPSGNVAPDTNQDANISEHGTPDVPTDTETVEGEAEAKEKVEEGEQGEQPQG